MRTERSLKNAKYALIGHILLMLINFVTRKIFVMYLGQAYLSLNGIFTNIISILSLAELGIGPALVFSLYEPLAKNDVKQIKQLMQLYKKSYIIIGFIIMIAGVIAVPFLPIFVSSTAGIDINIVLIFAIFVLTSAESYFFSYKASIFQADQRRYVSVAYEYGFLLLLNVLQIIGLIITKNYLVFILLKLVLVLIESVLCARRADKEYPYLKEPVEGKLDPKVKNTIVTNTKAMVIHRISSVVVFSTDNLILSTFDFLAVGIYSNYVLVTNALTTSINHIFNSMIASVGNLGVTESSDHAYDIFNTIYFLSFWIYGFSFVCLTCLFNPFLELIFGSEYIFKMPVVISIVVSFYLTGMRVSSNMFRQAYGLYSQKIFIPVLEAIINLVVSVILVKTIGTAGVFVGTCISTLSTCFWFEPWLVFKYIFKRSKKQFWLKYAMYTLITIGTTIFCFYICLFLPKGFLGFCMKCFICLVIPNMFFAVIFKNNKDFQKLKDIALNILRNRNIIKSK